MRLPSPPALPPRLLLATAVLAIAGCATSSDPGWHGSPATAMGTADAVCSAEAQDHGASESGMAYEACMRRQGWTRERRD